MQQPLGALLERIGIEVSEVVVQPFRYDAPSGIGCQRVQVGHALGLLASGRYRCFAHPDLFGHFCTKWTPDTAAVSRDIAQAARDLGIPLEINTSGFNRPDFTDADGSIRKPYPWRPFWEVVADAGAPVVIGSDCHVPEAIAQQLGPAYALVDDLGLNLVDTLL